MRLDLSVKDIEGPTLKILIPFVLIHVIALYFFFPKWGHMLLYCQKFSFKEHLNEGHIIKYRKNHTFFQNRKFLHFKRSFFFNESNGF